MNPLEFRADAIETLLSGIAIQKVIRKRNKGKMLDNSEFYVYLEAWFERNESDGIDEIKALLDGFDQSELRTIIGRILEDFISLGLITKRSVWD